MEKEVIYRIIYMADQYEHGRVEFTDYMELERLERFIDKFKGPKEDILSIARFQKVTDVI